MLKNAWMFFPIILVTACVSLKGTNQSASTSAQYIEASMESQQSAGHWIAGPRDNQFIIIGVSGRLSRPSDEIDAAKKDAARKASMYNEIKGSVEHTNSGSGSFFDYVADSKLELNYDTNYDQYLEKLTFNQETDVIRSANGVYVRMRYNAANSLSINYTAKINKGRPTWISSRDLPEVPDGYIVGIGYAGKRGRFSDTINASCDSAAAKLIETASSQVNTSVNSNTGKSSTTASHIYSEGKLSNFQIIEFYVDPDNGSVSTLAVARVSK